MRRQLVPGPVVRLTVIKAKTRPGIEARPRGGYTWCNSMGCYLCQNDYDNVHTCAFICTLQYACQHAYARYNMHATCICTLQYACMQHAYAPYNMHACMHANMHMHPTICMHANMHVNIIYTHYNMHIHVTQLSSQYNNYIVCMCMYTYTLHNMHVSRY